MLISEEYRRLNTELHQRSPEYGSRGDKWSSYVRQLVTEFRCETVLDYGCGKAPLDLPGTEVRAYDPARLPYVTRPDPADLVVCTDVLEHVEPACLAFVLADLHRVTRKLLFATIATRLSGKTLADGRDAHLIVKPTDWWLGELKERFIVRRMIESDDFTYWKLRHYTKMPRQAKPEFFVVAAPR